jgi:hypothetical protein
MKAVFLFAVTIASFSVFSQDQYSIQPDRPGLGESSQVLRKGYLQIESGGNFQWDKQENTLLEPIYTKETSYNSTFLRLGLSEFCEFRFAWNIGNEEVSYTPIGGVKQINRTAVGLSPISLGFKAKVLEGGGWIPSLALLGMMGIPNWASSHLQSSSFSPSILLPLEWDLNDKWLLTINAGAFWDGEVIEPAAFGSVGIDWMAFNKVGLFVEGYGNYQDEEGILPGFNGGVVWQVRENLQLDVSAGVGLNERMPDGFINGGISYRLHLLKTKR